jgi:PTS system N-acetylgalactosamine-specific IID component
MATSEYIIPEHYVDTTPAAPLDQKTLNKMVWRSLFLQASFNYERMQACGWLYAILPGLEKIHTNKDDLAASMSHNMEFFNTHPFLVTFVMGIVLSMEQNKSDIPMIRAVRVSAMGPLGGIGDALFWFTLVPITAGITSNMAINGSIAAPFIFLIVFNVFQFVIRFWLMNWSYKMGTNAIGILTENAKEFTRAASILGVFVVGCLTVCYGGTKLGLVIPNGETSSYAAQTATVKNDEVSKFDDMVYDTDGTTPLATTDADGNDVTAGVTDLGNGYSEVTYMTVATTPVTIDIQSILDGICPKLIPLGITLMLYLLLAKKNWTPIKCIGLILVIGLVGSGFGIWPSIW